MWGIEALMILHSQLELPWKTLGLNYAVWGTEADDVSRACWKMHARNKSRSVAMSLKVHSTNLAPKHYLWYGTIIFTVLIAWVQDSKYILILSHEHLLIWSMPSILARWKKLSLIATGFSPAVNLTEIQIFPKRYKCYQFELPTCKMTYSTV